MKLILFDYFFELLCELLKINKRGLGNGWVAVRMSWCASSKEKKMVSGENGSLF